MQTFYNGLGSTGSVNGTNGTNNAFGGTTGSVQYINTGVTLDVRPRVNPGGLVYLDIQQEVSNPGPTTSASGNPPISQRQIQTQVAVQSGETLMLGGLIQDNRTDGNTGLPLISKVPFLRNLFGQTAKHKNRTELIVLITPRVIANVRRGAADDRGLQPPVRIPRAAAGERSYGQFANVAGAGAARANLSDSRSRETPRGSAA